MTTPRPVEVGRGAFAGHICKNECGETKFNDLAADRTREWRQHECMHKLSRYQVNGSFLDKCYSRRETTNIPKEVIWRLGSEKDTGASIPHWVV